MSLSLDKVHIQAKKIIPCLHDTEHRNNSYSPETIDSWRIPAFLAIPHEGTVVHKVWALWSFIEVKPFHHFL